jgi:predicted site-specific integrase-resolvase
MDTKLVKIGEAAKILGTKPDTLRKWDKSGELIPDRKTKSGTRYYNINTLLNHNQSDNKKTICYARVSSHDEKADLERQQIMLESYCAAKGWQTETIKDIGSGMNYGKKGLKKLLDKILNKQIERLVLTHKDRLLRFGAELVFSLCESQNIEIVIIHQGDQPSFEEELAQDVLEIITVFSARLYGSRSHKNKKLMEALMEALNDVVSP